MANWLCPLCGIDEMSHGETCEEFQDETCENMDKLNVNGQMYLRRLREKKQTEETKGTGISQISDE